MDSDSSMPSFEEMERIRKGYSYIGGLFGSQGWQCSICGRVYSPYTPMCLYCGNSGQTTITSTGTDTKSEYINNLGNKDGAK